MEWGYALMPSTTHGGLGYSGLNSGAKIQSPWAQGIPGRLEQGLETGSSTRTNMLTHRHCRSALPPLMLLEAEELG